MKNISFLTTISVRLIKRFWQNNLGLNYKKKHKIICRFYPDCSNYAVRALQKYGFIKGWILAYKRVKRCTNDNTESCIDYP